MIQFLIGVAVTFASAYLLYLWNDKYSNRIYIRRINSSYDQYVPQLLELYQANFPEEAGTNYDAEEIMEYMDVSFKKKRHVKVENIVLTAMQKEVLLGFVICHFYPEQRKAIVSFIAIDKTILDSRKAGISPLIKKLKSILTYGNRCDLLFFDLEGSNAPELKARRVLFKHGAKSHGLIAQEFEFNYRSPRISMEEWTRECPFALFCIGINGPIPKEIAKETIMEYLRFIYLDCYGDVYAVSDPRFAKHRDHLKGVLKEYETSLPDRIATKS